MAQKTGSFRIAAAAAAAIALLATGCGPSDGGGGGAEDGRLVVGLSSEPGTFAPGQDTSTVGYTINALVHRGLMAYDAGGELIPALAESVETDDDTNFEVVLREGLTFSDGSPLTAENVEESFEYLSDPDSPGAVNQGLQDIESMEVISDTELAITLGSPNNAFVEYLAIPTAAVFPASSLEADEDSWEGAGPFVLDTHTQGQSMVLSKNESYYGAADVALQELELVFYADGTARSNALLSGDVDVIDYVPWEDFDSIEAQDGLTLDSQNGPFMYLLFNVEDGPFSDPLLRQALAYAINRENTVQAAFAGHGEPLYGVPVSEDDPAYDPAWEELWSHDVERARELVAESGFDTSQEITLLANSQYTFHQDVALSVQADMQEIGLTVTLDSPDWATRTQKATEGDYDILVNGNVGTVTDIGYIGTFVGGAPSPVRSHGYSNEALSDLVAQGASARTGEDKKAAFDQARELIVDDVPFVMVNTRGQANAYSSDVSGFATLPGFLSFYSGYSFAYVE